MALETNAQETMPPGFELWSSASVASITKSIGDEAHSDPHHFAVGQLADYPNDSFLLVHRAGDGQVEWHETQADVFLVLSGSATLIVGGKLLNGETVGPHEKRNGTIEGGIRKAGDRVGSAWIQSTCGRCEWCQRGRRMFCPYLKGTGAMCKAVTPNAC
jgi:hypothetical protein